MLHEFYYTIQVLAIYVIISSSHIEFVNTISSMCSVRFRFDNTAFVTADLIA